MLSVAKETSNNDAYDNICMWVRGVWFGCAPQPSAAGECMIDVPMVHMYGRRLGS